MRFWDLIESNDQETTENSSVFDELSRTQRLYAFAICVLSTVKLTFGNLKGFAILYTVGNILAFTSTGFIVGFKKQFKTMFAPGKK
ncbi:5396_t:CDS:2 [Diversispora eburnea]|uniref:Protein transport protein SFT2 n=1 Tax=Diversispora eburnea TaxID=1213867 RepID=A0A9N8V7Z9_9GLOM|nr:5396_t:CDS:2 [Diversispora eburnea]